MSKKQNIFAITAGELPVDIAGVETESRRLLEGAAQERGHLNATRGAMTGGGVGAGVGSLGGPAGAAFGGLLGGLLGTLIGGNFDD